MIRQTKISISSYTRDGQREHTVLVGGLPIIRETLDEAAARAAARREYDRTPGYPSKPTVLVAWDGDLQTETELARKTTSS